MGAERWELSLDEGTVEERDRESEETTSNRLAHVPSHEGITSQWLTLAERAAPVPHEWARIHGLVGALMADRWQRRAGLWWLPGPPGADVTGRSSARSLVADEEPSGSTWEAACRRSPHLPWGLWSAIRALGADGLSSDGQPTRPASEVALLVPHGALATIGDVVVRLRAPGGPGMVILRLGHLGTGAITPGETLEEQLAREAAARVTKTSYRQADRRLVATELALDWGDAQWGAATWTPPATWPGPVPDSATERASMPARGLPGEPVHPGHSPAAPDARRQASPRQPTRHAARDPEPYRGRVRQVVAQVEPAAEPAPTEDDLGDDLSELLAYDEEEAQASARDLVHVAAANWDDVMAVEVERARQWLAGDGVLGRVCLLGPLSFRTHRAVQLRRDAGFLNDHFGLTVAGWWRLAYLAGQGVGRIERRRARVLGRATPRCRRQAHRAAPPGGNGTAQDAAAARTSAFSARHLLLTQRACLDYMRAGATPLGIEFSALGDAIQGETGYRPDALLVQPDGTMVWVEVNLRPASRLARDYHKYRYIERRHARDVCLRLGRPVVLHLAFGRTIRRIHYRPGELYGTEAD
jgi:hypothetical protein